MINIYVDTAATSGDGTTQNHSGATAAYASLSAAEASLGTLTDDVTIHCAGTLDNVATFFSGITLAGYTITITSDTTAPDGDGRVTSDIAFDYAYYYMEPASGTALTISQDGITVEKLQFLMRNGNNAQCVRANLASGTLTIDGNRFISDTVVRSGCEQVALEPGGGPTIDVVNNIFNHCINTTPTTNTGVRVECDITGADNGTYNIFNNTFYDLDDGISVNVTSVATGNTITIKNNVFANCDDDYFLQSNAGSATITIDYNASEDLDGTNTVDIGSTAGDWEAEWTDPTNATEENRDFTVKSTSADLKEGGTTGGPALDIQGTTRDTSTPTLGAFELVSAATTSPFIVTSKTRAVPYGTSIKLNRNSPLTRNLHLAAVPMDDTYVDLVGTMAGRVLSSADLTVDSVTGTGLSSKWPLYPGQLGDWVSHNNITEPGSPKTATWSAWARCDATSGSAYAVCGMGEYNERGRFTLSYSADAATAYANIYTMGSFTKTSSLSVTLGEIHHIVGTVTSSGVVTVYVNGVKGTPSTTTSGSMNQSYLLIGGRQQRFKSSGEAPFQGAIGPVCYWNRVLTDAEIYSLYDPQTRWDLYWQPRRTYFIPGAAETGVVVGTNTFNAVGLNPNTTYYAHYYQEK